MTFRARPILLLICLAFSASTPAQDLSSIGQLARDGAPELAIKILDQIQPEAEGNFEGWMFFERQRVEIMREWRMWGALVERLEQFPADAPRELRRWAKVEMANARLQSGDGKPARAQLRQLLWQPPGLVSPDEFSLYRRLVIRSYLVDDKLGDARRAMVRYEQDYGNKGDDWLKLQARVYLRTDRPVEAERLFNDMQEPDAEARALELLARLRSERSAPATVLGKARDYAGETDVAEDDQARLWTVAAEAAAAMNSHLTLTRALETAALLSPALPDGDGLFAFSGDRLWDAYLDYGMDEGNSMQFLLGQDSRWLDEAAKWSEERAQRERAFLSVVMFKGASAGVRRKAYDRFLQSVLKIDKGVVLLQKLFLDSSRFPAASGIPNTVRYVLVDDALEHSDIDLATRLMSGLDEAPEGADALEWGMRRARVLILGGKYKEGIDVLNGVIDQLQEPPKETVDRITQVVFDLQTVGEDEQAIKLFEKLQKLTTDSKLHRELIFWQADSYKALDRLPRAALYYLKSATLLDGKGFDPWGQTARFRAAEVLTEAGLIGDARRLYEGLLKVTPEPSRRAMIRYKLQELWLKEQ